MTPRNVPVPRSAKDAGPWSIKAVQTLSGDDIGRMMRFYRWDAVKQIANVVTAELRQISHNSVETHLTYGYGADEEHTFQNGEVVSLDPPFSFADVVELRQQLCDFHGITETLP